MAEERFLVTGAMGCIGAWVVRLLLGEGVPTTVFDLATNRQRLELIMTPQALAEVQFIHGDITDLQAVERAFAASRATHAVHLAALQVPFCAANPPLGAAVNVVGTVNMFEAAKNAGLERLVYASSIAVYGQSEEYDTVPAVDAPLSPRTHYGVYKQANEGTARIYFQDVGLSSIGLRPYIVYGPARDQGMTSTPTKAMLAAAAGQPYHITFSGRGIYHYTADIARVFILAARSGYMGAGVFNAPGRVLSVAQIIDAIERVVPALRGQLTAAETQLPFPAEVDVSAFTAAIGEVSQTPLDVAVADTIDLFRQALREGRLAVS